jgi:hypothetical protein
VIGGGMPIGMLAGSRTYMDALDGGSWQYGDDSSPEVGVTFFAGTFVRHPLTMAAVKACLEHLRAAGPSLQTALAARTGSLVGELNRMFADYGMPTPIEHFQSVFYFPPPNELKLGRMLYYHLREQGVHLQEGFPCFLTTAHSDEDLNFVREAFASSLERMRQGGVFPDGGPAPATAPLPLQAPAPEPESFPLTEAQREVLLGTQLGEAANCAFNEGTFLRLRGQLDVAALESALAGVVARHDSLRLTVSADGERMLVHPAGSLPVELRLEDLSLLAPEARAARRDGALEEESATAFDLTAGPLYRARLLRLGDDEHLFVFTAHHIIYDGWSANILYRELGQLYSARVSGSAPSLPAAEPFFAYAAGLAARAQTAAAAATERFWLEQFESIPEPLNLPLDHPRPGLRSNQGTTLHHDFPGELLAAARKAGAAQGSTLFATLLGSFTLLLHRITAQDDLVVGIPMAGQSQAENGASLLGHCIHFLPVRSQLGGGSMGAHVKAIRGRLLDAQDHLEYTYGTLLQKLAIPRDPSRLQLIEVQFNLETVGAGLAMTGLETELRSNAKTTVNTDIFFNLVDRGSVLSLECDYNTALFEEASIRSWIGYFENILRCFIADAGQPADAVPLVEAEALAAWYAQLNDTAAGYPAESSIVDLVTASTDTAPTKEAAIGLGGRLSYAELEQASNRLAAALRAAGAAPGAGRIAPRCPQPAPSAWPSRRIACAGPRF